MPLPSILGRNVTDPRNLPHLIRLIDDESDVVRDTVLRELSSYGPYLEIELSRHRIAQTPAERHQLRNLLGQHGRRWMEHVWPTWKDASEDKAKLEKALGLIAQFQYGQAYPARLTPMLDKLTEEFRHHSSDADPLALAAYLFKTKGMTGAEEDYSNPFHSNLVYVLEELRGIPISLASIYILVGSRLGLDIEGVNFPGHFLSRVRMGGKTFVVDGFNGGRFLGRDDLAAIQRGPAARISELLDTDCPAEVIVARTLRNLVYAYRQSDQPENAAFFRRFLDEIASEAGEDGAEGS